MRNSTIIYYTIAMISYTMALYILYHGIISYTIALISYTMALYPIPWHCIISYTMALHPIPWHYILYHVIISYTMALYPIPWHYIPYHGNIGASVSEPPLILWTQRTCCHDSLCSSSHFWTSRRTDVSYAFVLHKIAESANIART